jgi:chemotaxis protein CheX
LEGTVVEIPEVLIESFATAVSMTFSEMAGVEAVVHGKGWTIGTEGLADLSVSLRLSAGSGGWLALSFPARTALDVTLRILKEVGCEVDESIIQDCVCELTNVTAGQAKTLLFGTPYQFTFSTPNVLPIISAELEPRRFVIRFDSEVGEFALHLCFPLK